MLLKLCLLCLLPQGTVIYLDISSYVSYDNYLCFEVYLHNNAKRNFLITNPDILNKMQLLQQIESSTFFKAMLVSMPLKQMRSQQIMCGGKLLPLHDRRIPAAPNVISLFSTQKRDNAKLGRRQQVLGVPGDGVSR